MTDTDLHTLAGAYALDALPNEEVEAFERHLATCQPCQEDVAEFRATAAHLASPVALTPPASLKEAVFAEIDQTRQDPPLVTSMADVRELRRRRRVATGAGSGRSWGGRLGTVAASAVAIAALGLGLVLGRLSSEPTGPSSDAVLAAILSADDATFVVGDGPGESSARAVVSPTTGEAVVVMAGMAPAPSDRIYELWIIGSEGATPAGLFDVEPGQSTTQVVTGDLTDAMFIGVTLEPSGGSQSPTSDPLVLLPLTR